MRRSCRERTDNYWTGSVVPSRATRDQLLLTGVHDLDGEAPTDIEDADPNDASSWRDWVQPELLSEETLETLECESRTTGRISEAAVTVSVPTPPADWRDGGDPVEPRTFEWTPGQLEMLTADVAGRIRNAMATME